MFACRLWNLISYPKQSAAAREALSDLAFCRFLLGCHARSAQSREANMAPAEKVASLQASREVVKRLKAARGGMRRGHAILATPRVLKVQGLPMSCISVHVSSGACSGRRFWMGGCGLSFSSHPRHTRLKGGGIEGVASGAQESRREGHVRVLKGAAWVSLST